MKKLLCLTTLLGFLCGCGGEPKYAQPTERGTKAYQDKRSAGGPGKGGASKADPN